MIFKNPFISGVLAFVAIFQSCKPNAIPKDVESALLFAKGNSGQLKTVLDHYSADPKDSLKLRAAAFLIKNLEFRSYTDGPMLRNYLDYPNFVLRDLDHGEYIMNSFEKIYGPYVPDSLKVYRDLQEVKSNELIENIDVAFEAWQQQPWCKDYSFDQFCNYILPYRVEDEIPCYDRNGIYRKFDSLLNLTGNKKQDAVSACVALNNEFIKDGWTLSARAAFLPHNPAYSLIENRIGTCREMVDLGIYVMRAVGIPTASDFIPQWPYRKNGHSWNVVIDRKGKAIPFLAAEDSPGTPHRPKTKKGKVYRLGFTKNPSSLAEIAGHDDYIPHLLSSPYMVDVTDEYAKVHTVKVPLKLSNNNFVYLSVFDNINWVPIAWARNMGDTATFNKIEGGIVFLPTYETIQGQIPAGFPLWLSEAGTFKKLIPDTANRISSMICDRVYPIVPESYHADMATGGILQVSDNKDFKNAITVHQFQVRALPGWNEINMEINGRYRYVRFLSAKQKRCEIAEMEVFSGQRMIAGSPIGNANEDPASLRKAFDRDTTTAYSSTLNASSIGLDLTVAVRIDKIRLMTKIDIPENNLIIPQRSYTLKYWNGRSWRTISTEMSKKANVEFSNVPSNALFLLSSSPDLADTRIFTYENGRQIWH